MRVIRGFPAQNIVACFVEAAGGGNIEDINAPCNAPAKTPHLYLSSVIWHSDFFQFELAMPEQVITINHPTVAGRTRYFGVKYDSNSPITSPTGVYFTIPGNKTVTEHTLLVHGLPYVPKVFVSYGGHMLGTGEIVQIDGGRCRTVSVFADETVVGLREVAYPTDTDCPAVLRTYRVLVFRNPEPVLRAALFSGPSPVTLARGKIASNKAYLRKAGAGSSAYALNLARTMDMLGGRVRFATGGSIVDEPGYPGSFAGSAYRSVGA